VLRRKQLSNSTKKWGQPSKVLTMHKGNQKPRAVERGCPDPSFFFVFVVTGFVVLL
jgi:hypothetical protein